MASPLPWFSRLVCVLLLPTVFLASGCGKKEVTIPLADQLKKVWVAQTVRENSTLAYTKGGSNNIRNYSTYQLDLSRPPSVSFTDWDGVLATGQYEVVGDNRLVLKNLSPQPTGTGGTIEFSINSVSDTQLNLTRITNSLKTGGTTNQYLLINP